MVRYGTVLIPHTAGLCHTPTPKVNNGASEKLNQYDLSLFKSFSTAKCAIHHAFCNSIDTPSVIEQIRELLSTTNNYMNRTSENVHRRLVQNIYNFFMHLFDILGLKYDLKFVDDMQSTRSIQQQTSTINENDHE